MEVLETCLYASDLERAREFYEGVLGLECIDHSPPRHSFFRTDGGMFLVFNPDVTGQRGRLPAHGATGIGHVCFSVPAARLDHWRKRLDEAGLDIEPVTWKGGLSLYVHDPAGNLVELAPADIWGLDSCAVGPTSPDLGETL